MYFDKERLLNLAGLTDGSSAELMTEGVKPTPPSEEQKLRRLVREELTRILQEREDKNIQDALKRQDLRAAFKTGTPGFASGMVHGNKRKSTSRRHAGVGRGSTIFGIGFS